MADNNDFDDFDDGSPMDYYSDDSEDHAEPRESNCTILKEADICQCMDHEITELSSVLSISKIEASLLLRHYNWSVSKVHDAWFADEFGVRKKVGFLLEKPKEKQVGPDDLTCGICFESYSHDLIKSVSCGHPFCSECWGLYIHTNVNDGPGCLLLSCPEPKCVVAVADNVVDELAYEEDRRKYYHYLARSYVESNKKRKWCPAPGCDYAIDFVGCDGNFDVTCVCSHSFCFNCCEERHRPVGCDTVKNWNLKNSSDSQNETWKKAYTKPCPKCHRPIEKNSGCMRMSCSSPCNYVFCWICLKDWSAHGYQGSCNRYTGNPDLPEETSPLRQELLKYQHYYDRWAANEKSRQIALADLEKVQEDHIKVIAQLYGQPQTQLEFLTEAWQQIAECRRVLKWTYAYGFYLPEDEDAKAQLFEYLQGQAESSLERLHDCAERELKTFLDWEELSEGFNGFQKNLTHLTRVTKNYFENLVTALENGLSDVASCSKQQKNSIHRRLKVPVEKSCNRMTTPKNRSSYLFTALTRTYANPHNTQAQRNAMGAALVTPTPTKRKVTDNVTPQGEWSCKLCTYMNPGTAEICEACKRGAWICQYCTYANPRTATSCQMCADDQ